jgi:hypothetical protein
MVQGPDGTDIRSLDPGEALIQADTIWTPDGERLLKTGDAAGGSLSGSYPNPILQPDLASELGVTDGGVVRGGMSFINGKGTRNSTLYGPLDTGTAPGPDQVPDVVLPTGGGLIFVVFVGVIEHSVADAGAAAIFLNSTQVKISNQTNGPGGQLSTPSTTANNPRPIYSTTSGLQVGEPGSAADYLGHAHTGQIVGHNGSAGVGREGGITTIFVDNEGTYNVSIQFKATSGTVSCDERRLYVWTKAFVA